MKRKFHTPEQIINKLRQADAAMASGSTVEQALGESSGMEVLGCRWLYRCVS